MYFGEEHGSIETDVHRWNTIERNTEYSGPVVIESDRTTAVAGPKDSLRVAGNGDILIRANQEGGQ